MKWLKKRVREAGQKDQGEEMEKVGEIEMFQTFRSLSVELMEMYSPPRGTEEAKKFGMVIGAAMELTTGWDSSRPDHRQKEKEWSTRRSRSSS